jgi:hypothetical protein
LTNSTTTRPSPRHLSFKHCRVVSNALPKVRFLFPL